MNTLLTVLAWSLGLSFLLLAPLAIILTAAGYRPGFSVYARTGCWGAVGIVLAAFLIRLG